MFILLDQMLSSSDELYLYLITGTFLELGMRNLYNFNEIKMFFSPNF